MNVIISSHVHEKNVPNWFVEHNYENRANKGPFRFHVYIYDKISLDFCMMKIYTSTHTPWAHLMSFCNPGIAGSWSYCSVNNISCMFEILQQFMHHYWRNEEIYSISLEKLVINSPDLLAFQRLNPK